MGTELPGNTYYDGDLIYIATGNPPFENLLTGTPTDPTEVIFAWSIQTFTSSGPRPWSEYRYPSGAQIVRAGVGLYTVTLDTTGQPGTYTYLWAGTGACQVTGPPNYFTVLARTIAYTR